MAVEVVRRLAERVGSPPEEAPPGFRMLGRPGVRFAIALVPILVWLGYGLAIRRIRHLDRYESGLEAHRASPDWSRWVDPIGPADAAGVPVFVRYLGDPDATVRRAAAGSLITLPVHA